VVGIGGERGGGRKVREKEGRGGEGGGIGLCMGWEEERESGWGVRLLMMMVMRGGGGGEEEEEGVC